GYVGGVSPGGRHPSARGGDRLRSLPRHQALQREALRAAPGGVPRGDRRAAQGGAQGDAVAALEETREPRRGEGREAAVWGRGGGEKAAGDGLLPEAGPAAILGDAGQAVRDGVPERRDPPSRGLRGEDAPADGQDVSGPSDGAAGVLRRDDHEWTAGGDEQQDQDDEASGIWVPGSGVLQAEDPGDSRDAG